VKKKQIYIVAAAAGILFLVLPAIASAQSANMNPADLIASFEGFSATPYWDVSRYSWGYGTPAPGATGTITRPQALVELQGHSQADYEYLQPMITRPLTGNQWAAYLSFAYQEGTGGADNLVDNINSGDDQALAAQWRLYNKVRDANGNLQYNADVAARRERELQIWNS
jgi:GH24 family phage-related lysozyme (muramidase)